MKQSLGKITHLAESHIQRNLSSVAEDWVAKPPHQIQKSMEGSAFGLRSRQVHRKGTFLSSSRPSFTLSWQELWHWDPSTSGTYWRKQLCSLGCFKTDLWENRHNLPCDIFLLGTSPVNPHTSPQLRPGKGAQSCHRTHVPARWLLAQQLKPICFPSLVLSWFLMPELQTIALWMFPVTSPAPQGIQDVQKKSNNNVMSRWT